ncbi:MAG TPA: tetratricopeptide repeat protein [Planctomycetaceae bacterium]|nr:tetratricopeptide repeat protein [Planctomycetaceae bacterium]
MELRPEFARAYANRGYVHKELGQPEQALPDYHRALALAPDLAQAHNDLAWLRATWPTKTFRNGKEAVRHARRACDLTEFRNPAI